MTHTMTIYCEAHGTPQRPLYTFERRVKADGSVVWEEEPPLVVNHSDRSWRRNTKRAGAGRGIPLDESGWSYRAHYRLTCVGCERDARPRAVAVSCTQRTLDTLLEDALSKLSESQLRSGVSSISVQDVAAKLGSLTTE